MSAPQFILEAETVYNTVTTPKTTAAFNAVQGDVLVAYAMSENVTTTIATPTTNGVVLVFTLQQSVAVAGFGWLGMWTHVLTGSRAGLTVTFTAAGGGQYGGNLLLIRGSDGVGASSKTNTTGAPSLSLTTTRANSIVVVANVDFTANAGARTWRANFGALTETTYSVQAGAMTVYGGYHADAGQATTTTVGLTAPSTQTYSIAAVEILGQNPPTQTRSWRVRMRG